MYKVKPLIEKLKNFRTSRKEEISFVMNFVSYTVIYGTLVSIPMCVLTALTFGWGTIPALGISVYIIKEEVLPEIHKIISLIKTR